MDVSREMINVRWKQVRRHGRRGAERREAHSAGSGAERSGQM